MYIYYIFYIFHKSRQIQKLQFSVLLPKVLISYITGHKQVFLPYLILLNAILGFSVKA